MSNKAATSQEKNAIECNKHLLALLAVLCEFNPYVRKEAFMYCWMKGVILIQLYKLFRCASPFHLRIRVTP